MVIFHSYVSLPEGNPPTFSAAPGDLPARRPSLRAGAEPSWPAAPPAAGRVGGAKLRWRRDGGFRGNMAITDIRWLICGENTC